MTLKKQGVTFITGSVKTSFLQTANQARFVKPLIIKQLNFFMDAMEFILKAGEIYGFPALVFAIWFIYHKAENKKWNSLLDQINEERKNDFTLLKDAIDNIGLIATSVKELSVEFRTFKTQHQNR
jgi:hypothetical protein